MCVLEGNVCTCVDNDCMNMYMHSCQLYLRGEREQLLQEVLMDKAHRALLSGYILRGREGATSTGSAH